MTFIEDVITETRYFIENTGIIYANERHLQVALGMFLTSLHKYDKVHFEYRVPVALLKNRMSVVILDYDSEDKHPAFPWANSSNYFLDIVVENNGQFIPIELKYATRKIDNDYKLFNQNFSQEPPRVRNSIVVLNEQAAFDLIMYNYWKDVRRLEVVTRIFDNVAGGVALIVANSPSFWRKPLETSGYNAFSTHSGKFIGPGKLSWGESIGKHIRTHHPEFMLDGQYKCEWHLTPVKATRNGKPEEFKYLISAVGLDSCHNHGIN